MNKKFLALTISGALVASSAWSMTKPKFSSVMDPKKYYAIFEKNAPKIPAADADPYSPSESEKIAANIQSQRAPAQEIDGKVIASAEFSALSKEFFQITSASRPPANKPELLSANTDKLEAFLQKLELNYHSFKETDTKLFALELIPLRTMRGIVWKMIGIFNGRKTHPAHTLSLTAFKNFAGQMNIDFPDESWEVGFDYLTQPYVRDVKDKEGNTTEIEVAKEFDSLADFQTFVAQLAVAMTSAKDELKLLDVGPKAKPVVWDQKIVFGPKTLADDLIRYKRVGELEKQLLLSNMYFAISQLTFMQAYSLNGSLDIFSEIGWMYGLDSNGPRQFINGVEGITAKQMHNSLSAKYKDVVGVRIPGHQSDVANAFKNFKNALGALNAAWKDANAKDRVTRGVWLFNSGYTMRDSKYINTKFEELRHAVNGKVKVRNGVTGESATIDLPNFFDSPNFGAETFASLLPTDFVDPLVPGKEMVPIVLTDSKNTKYSREFRDYRQGSGKAWNLATYNKLFPDAQNQDQLKEAFRVFHSLFADFTTIKLFNGM